RWPRIQMEEGWSLDLKEFLGKADPLAATTVLLLPPHVPVSSTGPRKYLVLHVLAVCLRVEPLVVLKKILTVGCKNIEDLEVGKVLFLNHIHHTIIPAIE
ncbi:Uncharacterized protein FKW44_006450, partial [Caligus rogercresseyi]